jgi:hypothetical protein
MRLLLLCLLAGAILAQAPPAPAPSAETPTGPKSIGTMKELMLNLIFPTSNEIFYVGRNEEKTYKDWTDLQNNALMLGEAANILMADNRAKDKDLPALKALNDDLYEACQSCHEHYRPGYKRRL